MYLYIFLKSISNICPSFSFLSTMYYITFTSLTVLFPPCICLQLGNTITEEFFGHPQCFQREGPKYNRFVIYIKILISKREDSFCRKNHHLYVPQFLSRMSSRVNDATSIIAIRHGYSCSNHVSHVDQGRHTHAAIKAFKRTLWSDPGLTREGQRQAFALGLRFDTDPLLRQAIQPAISGGELTLYTSFLRRAIETAVYIRKGCTTIKPIRICPLPFCSEIGSNPPDPRDRFGDLDIDWKYRFVQGGDQASVEQFLAWVSTMFRFGPLSPRRSGSIVLITHGHWMRCLAKHYNGMTTLPRHHPFGNTAVATMNESSGCVVHDAGVFFDSRLGSCLECGVHTRLSRFLKNVES